MWQKKVMGISMSGSKDISKKQRLGRGLGSLLGGGLSQAKETVGSSKMNSQSVAAAKNLSNSLSNQKNTLSNQTPSVKNAVAPEIPSTARVWNVPVEKLIPNYYQPRQSFDKEQLEELAASIKQSGVLQPIVARKKLNGTLEIIAGERRWRASQIAGLREVPVIIKNLEDREALEIAIVENIQRAELNSIEEAEAYQRLITEFKLTQQQVAEKVGKERATVTNTLRLLTLHKNIREMIVKNELSTGHAKVLLSVQDPSVQLSLAKMVVNQKLSVRKLESLVQNSASESKNNQNQGAGQVKKAKMVAALSDELQKVLGTKVSIDYSDSKGKVSIYFYSDEELSSIVEKVKSGCRK
jgi:ParB family chromosome partitioning protein